MSNCVAYCVRNRRKLHRTELIIKTKLFRQNQDTVTAHRSINTSVISLRAKLARIPSQELGEVSTQKVAFVDGPCIVTGQRASGEGIFFCCVERTVMRPVSIHFTSDKTLNTISNSLDFPVPASPRKRI